MAKNSYGDKIRRLGRHEYDFGSKSFQQGAWKNQPPGQAEINRRALERRTICE